MKSKLMVTVFCVFAAMCLLAFQGDSTENNHADWSFELPPPPPAPDLVPEELPEELSRIMSTAGNPPSWYTAGGNSWMNYDFNSQSISQTNVDWPITIVFYGNATINKVKLIFLGYPGSRKYAAYDSGGGTQWDQDGGTKVWVTFAGPDGSDSDTLHLRYYAPPGTDYFDGTSGWGHYVIASTHFDFNPPWDTVVGYSEDAADMAVKIAASKGYTVYNDYFWINNYESLRNESNHWWQCDGYVSLVYVP
jgi:hypothetical protein